jgi:hypothetical protein
MHVPGAPQPPPAPSTAAADAGAPTTPTPTSPRPLEYPRVLFDETQRARQWWLWALMIGVSLAPAGLLLRSAVRQPRAWPFLPLLLLPCALPVVLLVLIRLRVTVTSTELVIRYFPLRRRIPLHDIAAWEATEYKPIREFGGWGIKWSHHDSTTAYSMYGTGGVRVVTAKGKKLLIGTQRPAELAAAIASAKGVSGEKPERPSMTN